MIDSTTDPPVRNSWVSLANYFQSYLLNAQSNLLKVRSPLVDYLQFHQIS